MNFKFHPLFISFALGAAAVLLGGGCASSAGAMQKKQAAVESALPGLASQIKSARLSNAAMARLMEYYLSQHPEVYGVAFAPEPAAPGQPVRPCPYVYRKDGVITTVDLARPDYVYKDMAWYANPVALKAPVWTAPYYDKGGGNIWMVTYSYPIYLDDAKTQLLGVLTDDLPAPAPK